jgi:peptidoglycan-associated lipoprotein
MECNMSRLDFGAKISKFAAVLFAAFLLAACANTADTTSGPDTSASNDTSSSAPAPGSAQDFLVNVQDRVYFGFDRYDLDDASRRTLERQAAWLDQYPGTTITVEGHCDERGTREYNLALGARRAAAVRDYLVSLGVDPARVRTISYGKERPVADGHNEAAWRLNRRGVTVVNSPYGS